MLCAKLKYSRAPFCHFCGEEIDLALPGTERRGWTLDHIEQLCDAPDRAFDETNLAPAHNECNASRGGRGQKPVRYSQKWR
jgi:hypothetical protein